MLIKACICIVVHQQKRIIFFSKLKSMDKNKDAYVHMLIVENKSKFKKINY